MSLGAAGCGHPESRCEYLASTCGHPESRCEYLASTLFGFSCKKYGADLRLWKGEPLRLRRCSDDAHKEWEKLRAEQRKKEKERGGERFWSAP